MSVQVDRGAWLVRWRDASGRQRGKRFSSKEAAQAFDSALSEITPAERQVGASGRAGGVYPYATKHGTRWYFKVRDSNGIQTSRRGFASERAARDAKRRLTERIERGEVRHTKETFGSFWERWLARRKPYLEPSTYSAYEIDGRKRLLPVLGASPLSSVGVDQVRSLIADLAEHVGAGEVSAKTVNNTLGTLVVCLNAAVEDGLIAANPAQRVERLPRAHIERDYLRLQEIPPYLDSCVNVYRPLAQLLIGTGMRISEALALRIGDLQLERTGGLIVVYRSSKRGAAVGSTKSDRFRSVEIGPGLAGVLRDQLARRAEMEQGDQLVAPVFVMPVRLRKRDRGRWASAGSPEPLDRTTVSQEWHTQALQDAGLRHMPLHSLRHTAAAAWLAAGNSLMYVQRQLGHADIRTTEQHYGHLERHVLAAGAVATEEAIARAVKNR